MAQIFWVENRHLEGAVRLDDRGIILLNGTLISWEEAKKLHSENPETGLLCLVLAQYAQQSQPVAESDEA